jgi:hypothetical protein
MSLISSLLAFVIIPLKARPAQKTPRDREVEALTFALDHWRDAGAALMKENERLNVKLDYWRATASNLTAENALLRADRSAQQAALTLLARQELAAYERQYGSDCTCVPARAQALSKP